MSWTIVNITLWDNAGIEAGRQYVEVGFAPGNYSGMDTYPTSNTVIEAQFSFDEVTWTPIDVEWPDGQFSNAPLLNPRMRFFLPWGNGELVRIRWRLVDSTIGAPYSPSRWSTEDLLTGWWDGFYNLRVEPVRPVSLTTGLPGLRCQNVVLSDDYVKQGRIALFLVHRATAQEDDIRAASWVGSDFGFGNENEQPWLVAGAIDGESITYGIPIRLPPDLTDPTNLHLVWEGCYGDAVFVGPLKFVVVWHRNYGERFMAVGHVASDLTITLQPEQPLQLWTFNPRSSREMAFGAQHLAMVTADVGVAIWGFSDFWKGGNDRFRARAFRVNSDDITMGQVYEVPQTDETPLRGIDFLPGPLMNLFKMGDDRVVFAGGRGINGPVILANTGNFDVWERYMITIRVDATNLLLSFGDQDLAQKATYVVKINDEYMFGIDNITETTELNWYAISHGALIKINSDDTFTEVASIALGRTMYSIFPFGEELVGIGEGGDIDEHPSTEQPSESDDEGVNPAFAVHMVDIDIKNGTLTKWQTPFYHESGSQLSSQSRKSAPFGDGRRTLVPGTAGAKPYVLVKPQIRQPNKHVQQTAKVQRKAKKHE